MAFRSSYDDRITLTPINFPCDIFAARESGISALQAARGLC